MPRSSASPARAKTNHSKATQYETRIDRFRVAAGIDLIAWRDALKMAGSSLAKIRGGRDIRVDTLARLVRTARALTGKNVRATDLYNVGEDDAPPKEIPHRRHYAAPFFRKVYDTPLDRLLMDEGLKPALVARKAGITRHALRHLRAAEEVPRVSTVAAIVGALRALTGKPVRAADLWDVGESEPHP